MIRSRHIRLMPATLTRLLFKIQELIAAMKTGLHTKLYVVGSAQLRSSVATFELLAKVGGFLAFCFRQCYQ